MTTPDTTSSTRVAEENSTAHEPKLSFFDRLYTGDGGLDFIAKTKLWYIITAVLLLIAVLAIAIRGFTMSIDFEGGTKLTLPAADHSVEEVEESFIDATGIEPELVQVVGTGASASIEINSERLSQEEITEAQLALYNQFQPVDATGNVTPDAVGASTVSESWGDTITQRMLISMGVFLLLAFIYISVRLQREMAIAAMLALVVDGILVAGTYALFGFEVSPAAIIGLLTVLAFSIYDTVIVFDKVRENTAGVLSSRRKTYAEAANDAVNETFMRSISTSVISALPIIALLVVAVWMLGVGALKDLALIQIIGVIEGMLSSIFLATPVLVSLMRRTKRVKEHDEKVAAYREGRLIDEPANDAIDDEAGAEVGGATGEATSAAAVPHGTRVVRSPKPVTERPSGTTWRPGQQ